MPPSGAGGRLPAKEALTPDAKLISASDSKPYRLTEAGKVDNDWSLAMSVPPPLSVVTGAGSGIGLALTRALLARSHDVVSIDRDVSAVDPRAIAHAMDVRDAGAMEALAASFRGRPVAHVFANAGVGSGGDVLDATDANWAWVFDVNVFAAIRTLRLWWPHLREGRGKAVATVSCAALQSYPGAGPYRASKAALLAALEGLHYQARGSGVTVHALCPGLV